VLELAVTGERDGRVSLEAPDMKLTGVRKLPLDGARASVAIRPEEMTIATAPAAENVIAGRVDNVEYGGRDSLVDVVTATGTRLHVRAPGTLGVGASEIVHVPLERVLVYPRQA
jgi:ABC-type sugar transport system ATPase subunit